MSQHFFKAGRFNVMAGWDRPLQHFFLHVEKDDAKDFVYDNLADPDLIPSMGGMTLEQVMKKLEALKIAPPSTLQAGLLADWNTNAGNRVLHYPEKETHGSTR